MLPQELFAEALWLKWRYHRVPVSIRSIHALLQRYNLKPKQTTTNNDLSLIIGRALKRCRTHTSKEQINKIAEETEDLPHVLNEIQEKIETLRQIAKQEP